MGAGGLTAVRERIAAAAARSGRRAEEVTLVAVSKGQSVDAVADAYAAGHRDFGENRADELLSKVDLLPDDIRWHFVGSLQSRKAKLVRPIVHLLHSLDRPKLVRAWAAAGEGTPPPVLIQVNIARESQKHGAAPEDVPALLDAATAAGIPCRGLMIIPPAPDTPEDSRRWFRALADLARRSRVDHPGLDVLSMGMTDDFEVAIEEGATTIRVGRAIFGDRDDSV
jgi:pyridoxal phosphate enzyme (YggS family)